MSTSRIADKAGILAAAVFVQPTKTRETSSFSIASVTREHSNFHLPSFSVVKNIASEPHLLFADRGHLVIHAYGKPSL